MKQKLKRAAALVLALLTLCGAMLFSSCSKAPKVGEIYDRTVYLIENAYALNCVFFGYGLPVYDRHLSVYQSLYSNSLTEQYTKDYDVVSNKAKFRSVEEIKEAAEKIFSPDLLEKVLYLNAFTGQVLDGSIVDNARYLEDGLNFYQYAKNSNSVPAPLIFDYASMKVVKPSNAKTVNLTLDAWEADTPDTVFSYRVVLVRGESGEWLLDKLTV